MNINIIGRGNVGTHLAKAFSEKTNVRVIDPHSLSGIDEEADLNLIAVSDSAISSVLENMVKNRTLKGIVAHTSGSTPIDVFNSFPIDRYGVFYPLQTFSKNKKLNYKEIPFFIEGSSPEVENELSDYARMISDHVTFADSEKRKRLHIAAVLSCNFVNHLWALSDKYLQDAGLSFQSMIPLIEETLDKVKFLPPAQAQTGPAVRRDSNIIQEHLNQLGSYPEIKEIYSLLTESIQK